MPGEDVILDKKTFQTLSSDTRINILKGLKNKRKTVSEISRELDINKSAVLKHLDQLMKTDLIWRSESKNQFVYYGLAEKGKQILRSEIKVKILLSLSALSFSTGVIQIYGYVKELILPPELRMRAIAIELFIGIILMFGAIILFFYSKRVRKVSRIAVE